MSKSTSNIRNTDGDMTPKRSADGAPKEDEILSPIMSAFTYFRSELDQHHDRRERIVKVSRDVTAQSKKIIFSLQRHRALGQPLSGPIKSDVSSRKAEIEKLLTSLITDLTGSPLSAARYARQISPGLQELVEAAAFEHYLTTQTLPSLDEVRTAFLPEALRPVLMESDYLLGLYDATGEIMRFAITGMATSGQIPSGPKVDGGEGTAGDAAGGRNVLTDLRALRAALEGLNVKGAGAFARECDKKAEVMRQSVEKVETAVYGLIVRGKERPKGWVPDARTEGPRQELREEVEGY